jgi:hypothetical protein
MKKDRKHLGNYDWSGDCDPNGNNSYPHSDTFSVGIFRWIAKNNFSGIKKGKVILRIKGDTSNPKDVYDAADSWCDMMDAGKMPTFKTVNMGFSK